MTGKGVQDVGDWRRGEENCSEVGGGLVYVLSDAVMLALAAEWRGVCSAVASFTVEDGSS